MKKKKKKKRIWFWIASVSRSSGTRHPRSMMELNKLVVKLGYKILNMNGKFCIRNKLFEKQSTADENICR
jgi:hypothetical protein